MLGVLPCWAFPVVSREPRETHPSCQGNSVSIHHEEGMMPRGMGSPSHFPASGWPPLAFPAPLLAVGEGPQGAFAPRSGAVWRGG